MRINFTLIVLISCLLQVNAKSYGQKINLTKSNISLPEMFDEIRKQTGYDFVYDSSQIKLARNVDVYARNSSLTEVLDKCFANQPFTFEIKNKTIIIRALNLDQLILDKKIRGVITDKKMENPLLESLS